LVLNLDFWSLEFPWNLVLGIWYLHITC
jgi:hypothetical protein